MPSRPRLFVLLLMNIATVFPLWPGNIGLLQAAVAATSSSSTASPTARASPTASSSRRIEMSVGVGVGLVMLARGGLLAFAAR